MLIRGEEIRQAIAALGADSPFSGLPTLVWSADASRILAAFHGADSLAAALSVDAEGRVRDDLPATDRLAALAGGLAPDARPRLERLRIARGPLAPLSTLACLRLALPSGETVLATAFTGPMPKVEPVVRVEPEVKTEAAPVESAVPAEGADASDEVPAAAVEEPAPVEMAPADEPASPEVTPEPEPAPVDPLIALAARGVVRFVWRADAEGRVREVSPALADAVGPEAGAIVGRTFAEIFSDIAHDPRDIVAELIARGETFSGRTVHWRVDGSDEGVAVDLAGLPVHARDRSLAEMRGFGLVRGDTVVDMPPRVVAAPMVDEVVEDAAAADEETPAIDEPAAETPPVESIDEPSADAIVADAAPDEPAGRDVPTADVVEAVVPEDRGEPVTEPVHEASGPASETEPAATGEPLAPEPAVAEAEFDAEPDAEPALPSLADGSPVDEPASAQAPPPIAEPVEEPVREPVEQRTEEPLARFAEAPAVAAAAGAAVASLTAVVAARLGEGVERDPFAPREAANDAAPAEAPAPGPARTEQPRAAPLVLSPSEHSAFREIARALGARYAGDEDPAPAPSAAAPARPVRVAAGPDLIAAAALERLPAGVVVHRGEEILYANRGFLDLLDHPDLASFRAAGGLAALVRGRPNALARVEPVEPSPLVLTAREGRAVAGEVRLTTVELDDGPASLLLVRRMPDDDPVHRIGALEAEIARLHAGLDERGAILDTATDGVVVIDARGRILSMNRSAEALFGHEENEVAGESVTTLIAPESHSAALAYLTSVTENGVASLLDGGREVLGRVRQGGTLPLFMTLGRIGEGENAKVCAVLRDMSAFKRAEHELIDAKRAAEEASAQKSDFLARISHEVRTPLNAIIGFAEVMREERFGLVGNERYKDYLADIHASGQHVLSLINDLLDLAKIEAGRMELSFRQVALNELVTACVALIQPQAARDRIVVRTSFQTRLPPVVADERSVRQIVLNLLSNAVKFTDAGGQVIVSTAQTDRGEVVFRVRDTGIGMSQSEVEAAVEPFRQLATSRRPGGTGLGLPLTKALVEANRGAMTITSKKDEGTLVEVTFAVTVGVGV